jgi:hypothetical protein
MGDFYKKDGTDILAAGGSICAPSGEYQAANHEQYAYPTPEGWYWFDDATLASLYFGDVPASVSNAQLRRALNAQNLLGQVDAAVQQIGGDALIQWEYASSFLRFHPLVIQIGCAMNKTEADIDNLFKAAAAL